MKKRLLKLKSLFIVMTLIFSLPMTVSATEQESEVIENQQNIETADDSESDMQYVYAMNATKSDVRTCQVNFNATIPNGMVNCYVVIMNNDTGTLYNIPLVAQNNYQEHIYVEAGNYTVAEQQFYDDNTSKYPFNPVDDFYLEDGDTTTIELTLVNYDSLNDEINQKRIVEEPVTETESVEQVEQIPIEIESTYKVHYNGPNPNSVALGIAGDVKAEHNLVVKITTPGTLGTAKFEYMMDKGNWSGEIEIPLSGIVPISNITLTFKGDAFTTEDSFTAFLPDPSKEVKKSENVFSNSCTLSTNDEHIYPYDIMLDNNYDIILKIVSGNNVKKGLKAIYNISTDGGISWQGERYMPDDNICPVEGTNLFITIDSKSFITDDSVYFYKPVVKKINYVHIAIACAIIFILLSIVVQIINNKKIPNSSYNINPYTPYKNE